MTLRALIAALLIAGCQARDDVKFDNVSITLPDDTTALPPGPNVELASATCTACHSADMITNQPRLTRAQWEANVEKMVTVYKANIDSKDVPQIVDYLVAIQSPDSTVSGMRLQSPSPLAGEGGARRRLAVGG